MAILGGKVGYNILRAYAGNGVKVGLATATAYENKSKLQTLMGKDFLSDIKGKVVIDFGCGTGLEAIEMAENNALKVIGVDIQERYLEIGRARAVEKKLTDRCHFTVSPEQPADIIVALDSFEHFDDPAQILRTMHEMLKPGGRVLASFGPTWYHPYGGHLFSVFPWAHLIFSEKVLIKWRSGFKTDGATRFEEVEGGLNQMTIRRFERLIVDSPFEIEELACVPIRSIRRFANPLTREFTTSIVRCKLRAKQTTVARMFSSPIDE
ncbi:MAG: class I SAM-dependent methyltransferase [Pseudohongiella sp.]|uniref:class I SAM-dependent methyltransferase n=1 Tax=Pseudohongiella sp. TaxID=1979412 RepID=UPI0034A0A9EC